MRIAHLKVVLTSSIFLPPESLVVHLGHRGFCFSNLVKGVFMKVSSKQAFNLLLLGLLTQCAHAEDKRIYQTDSIGNIQYNKPSYTIRNDGRIIQTDPIGNKQYDKQQYQIKGDKTYPVDSIGNRQYNKPQFLTK
jgi:hypothetical protein